MKIIDCCYRVAYRIAHPCLLVSCRLFRIRMKGVFVFIWVDGELLVVKNSYKQAYSLPGGLLKKGEEPVVGAIRETAEEVGVQLAAEQVKVISECVDPHGGTSYMAEAHLDAKPAIHIDQREIIWADFVPLSRVLQMHIHRDVRAYLERREQTAPAEKS